jgi:hypothetical protein
MEGFAVETGCGKTLREWHFFKLRSLCKDKSGGRNFTWYN